MVLDADSKKARSFIKKNGFKRTPVSATAKGRHIYFKHHGIMTFYKNFDYVEPLFKIIKEIGFIISADLTERQYICLILKK